MTGPRFTVWMILLLAPVAAHAAGGGLKGTVTASERQTPVANAVVMIEGPAVPATVGATHAVMDQHGQTFVPRVLAVAVGTTVDFPNSDPMLHNVFSASPAKKFDLGMYDRGETRSVTFDVPGVVRIGCNVHPRMEAFVVVHANPYAAVTNAQGEYTITGIPAGTYRARVWHETLAEKTVPITIREGGVERMDVRLQGH